MPQSDSSPSAIVLVGPSGSGKSTIGRALARHLGWTFEDADVYHAAASVGKMSRGESLTEADRAPWLGRLAALLALRLAEGEPVVLACSALRRSYRDRLLADVTSTGPAASVAFVWLDVPRDVLARRLENRGGHFAGPDLLASQLDTFEPSADLVHVDATEPPDEVARRVAAAVGVG